MDDVLPAASRAPRGLAVLVFVVGLMVSGLVPNVQAALISSPVNALVVGPGNYTFGDFVLVGYHLQSSS